MRTLEQLDAAFDAHVVESHANDTLLAEEIKGLRDDIKPMIAVFASSGMLKRAMMWILGFISVVIGIIYGIEQVLK